MSERPRALLSIGPTLRRTVGAVDLEVGPIDNSALRHLGFSSSTSFSGNRNSLYISIGTRASRVPVLWCFNIGFCSWKIVLANSNIQGIYF